MAEVGSNVMTRIMRWRRRGQFGRVKLRIVG